MILPTKKLPAAVVVVVMTTMTMLLIQLATSSPTAKATASPNNNGQYLRGLHRSISQLVVEDTTTNVVGGTGLHHNRQLEDTTNDDVAGTSDDDSSSLLSTAATNVFMKVAESAGSEVGTALVGWALSAVGFSQGDTAALNEISSELTAIYNELVDINTDLKVIQNELGDLIELQSKGDCQTALNNQELNNAIECINNSYVDYQDLMVAANKGYIQLCNNPDEPSMCALAWANYTVYGGGSSYGCPGGLSIQQAAKDLHDNLYGSDGALGACIPYIMDEYQDSDYKSFGEWGFFKNIVYPLVNKYYTVQIQALDMIVEASHLLAWNLSGQPNATDSSTNVQETMSQICDTSTSNATTDDTIKWLCAQSALAYNATLGYTQTMLGFAGLPFSSPNETLLEIIDLSSSPQMYPRSLEVFNMMSASPGDCPELLTSKSPCGNALFDVVGSTSNYEDVSLSGGFTSWSPMLNVDNFNRWFSTGGEGSAKSKMESFGFQNLTDKIFLGENVGKVDLTVAAIETYCCNEGCYGSPDWIDIPGTMTSFVDVLLNVTQNPVVDPNTILQEAGQTYELTCKDGGGGPNPACTGYKYQDLTYIDFLNGPENDRNYFYNGGDDYSDTEHLIDGTCVGTGYASFWNEYYPNKPVPGYWSGTTVGNQYTMPYTTIDWTDTAMCKGSKYSWSPTKAYRVAQDPGKDSSMPNTRCGPTFDYMADQYIPTIPVDTELAAAYVSP